MPRLTTLFDMQDRMSKKLRAITGDFKKLKSESDKPILIKATDRASKTIRSIDRSVHRLASRSYHVTVKSVDMASRSIGFIRNSLNSLPAWITIGVSVVGLEKLTRATIGAAAQMELAQVQVTSLFGENQKAAKNFFDFLNKAGANSMFSQEDFFGSGRAYVPLTKNLKELEYAVKITERLAASNPLEGMEGASFAIREALSGDMISLAERFNLPKTMLESIKAAPTLQKKLEKLDQLLSKMGYSQEYLNRVNETGYVRWQKLIDSTKLKFTEFGKRGLAASKPLIDDLTKIVNGEAFNNFGKVLSDGIVWGVEKAHTAVKRLDKYLSDPKFKNLGFEGKVKLVLGDINQWWNDKGKPSFDNWWNSSGKPWAEDVGIFMGEAIFKGITNGVQKGLESIGGMWKEAFKNPSIGSIGGATVSTLLGVGIASMLLSPIIKGLKGGGKAAKRIWDFSKSVKNKWPNRNNKKPPSSLSMSYDDHMKRLMTQQNKSSKKLRFSKISKLGSGISKKIPFLGTALSGLEIITAKGAKGKGKAIGSVIGGTLGSFLGPLGTIGGAAIGGYLFEKLGGWIGSKFSQKEEPAKPANAAIPQNVDMQGFLQTKIYQPLNQAVGNAQKFGQAFAAAFLIGINSAKQTPFNWISEKIYNPILQAVGNAKSFGWAFAQNFVIGMEQVQTDIHPWISTRLYQPTLQAVGNGQPFGSAYAKNIGLGVNSTSIDIHPWISKNLYQPILQAVGNGTSFGSAFVGNFILGMRSRKEDVSAEAKELARAIERVFRDEMGIHSPSRKMAELGYWSAMGVVKGFSSVDIKKFMEEQIGSFSSFGGKVGGNVKKWITAALMITGAPMSWLGPLSTMAMKESGGNPRAINLWDINAKRGTPSKGLMQTIEPTFNAYKLPGFNDIWNPIHNAIAAIRYIKARYGSVFNTPGIKNMSRGRGYKGYEKGGIINRQHLAMVGEKNKKEAIIPLEQHRNRALGLLSYAANKLGVQPQTLPTEAVQAASGVSNVRLSLPRMIGDIVLHFTGANHFSNEMDAEKVGQIAVKAVKKALEQEYFEGGAMAIYE
ncbi:transglycosylase SLT domain protein [Anoxybacillus sp. B7M1]|uniref:transglycosylase SLT domain-containing protein n=1 Tax=unclassified Anoxybacillus TaxID=2639704 RepID=UPI00069719CA|nr:MULTISPECIES: transglycosylase SLT domain-containing protein [unclassified Anoxybacillus]ANB55920.1 transglycosylase SLT domain protein [Anoxybacillus sp. B2M1]ANB63444.1 transglycosylase SLT domain protein [Anoxybacillus sp. B7M1]